jgi:PilZ domain-containing protein
VLNSYAEAPIQPDVSENPITPAAPAAGDVVEIVDRLSGHRVTAVVESASDGPYVLRFDRPTTVPDEAHVRWFDGDTAWQAISKLSALDETSASCELAPATEWEPAQVRRSLRAPVDNSPMLVKIISSTVLAKGRRVHAVCLDISDSGCRASWPGRTPLVGDAVDVAWEVGDWQAEDEPGWVSARVARIVALPFGARQVGFTFEIADADQAARVRAWHQAWLHEHRQRLLDQRAA